MKRKRHLKRGGICIAFAFLLLMACTKKGDPLVSAPDFVPENVNDSNVNYTNYVHDVIKNNCSTCHGEKGSAMQFWYNTNTYDNAVQYGSRIVETILEGSMPPVPRKPFSENDKRLLQIWLKKGFPE